MQKKRALNVEHPQCAQINRFCNYCTQKTLLYWIIDKIVVMCVLHVLKNFIAIEIPRPSLFLYGQIITTDFHFDMAFLHVLYYYIVN